MIIILFNQVCVIIYINIYISLYLIVKFFLMLMHLFVRAKFLQALTRVLDYYFPILFSTKSAIISSSVRKGMVMWACP